MPPPDSPSVLVARLLLVAGRLLLLAVSAAVVWCRSTRDVWSRMPMVDGLPDHPAVNTLMFAWVAFAILGAPCLLPWGSGQLATLDGDRLTVRSVLGRRSIGLDGTRLSACYVPGQGWGLRVFAFRRGRRCVIVASSDLHSTPEALLRAAAHERITVSRNAGEVLAGSGGAAPTAMGVGALAVVITLMFVVALPVFMAAGGL